jgi:hypothetical protein
LIGLLYHILKTLKMDWKTAFKIYMSKTHSFRREKNKWIPFTRGRWILMIFLFWPIIPFLLIMIPLKIYKTKKEGIPKENRKYYLYYKMLKGGKKQC